PNFLHAAFYRLAHPLPAYRLRTRLISIQQADGLPLRQLKDSEGRSFQHSERPSGFGTAFQP
ncbi:MAG TPA: hypothetical protein VFX10_09075, partial [Nitrospira sp.]|nr:hypothetical protein [Nitrospira sp.]